MRRQVSRGGFRTKREAQAHLTATLHALATGSYVTPERTTLAAYFEQWIAGASARLTPATVDKHRRDFAYVQSRLGEIPLQALTAVQLDALYAELLRSGGVAGRPLAPTTVHRIHSVLHAALEAAVRKGLVLRNVAAAATPPRPVRAAGRGLNVWSPEQLGDFLQAASEDRLSALWRLYVVTGCRRGEPLAATWADFDLEPGRWVIQRSLGLIRGAMTVGAPKSRQPRVVALDAMTVAELRAHRARQNEERLAWGPAYQDSSLVFCREDGTMLHPDTVWRRFGRIAEAAGLPRIRLHDVRHSAVTAMLRSGVGVKVVAERVGHASTSFTQDVYAWVLPDMQRDAAERMAAAVQPRDSVTQDLR
jgi:integrase